MTDTSDGNIVERLRSNPYLSIYAGEAADHIEALEARLDAAEKVVYAARVFLAYTDQTSNAATNPDWTEPNDLREELAKLDALKP